MTEKPTLGQAIDQAIAALEGLDPSARQTALTAVCTHLDLTAPQGPGHEKPSIGGAPSPPPPPLAAAGAASKGPKTPVDIRSLKEEKQPSSAKQMACIVGYYVSELAPEGERRESIQKADIEKYFKQAGYPLPELVQSVLPDAKKSGYFDSVARGSYKLNAVGYNLVVHKLPEASKS